MPALGRLWRPFPADEEGALTESQRRLFVPLGGRERGLRGGETRHRDAEWRAADVVQPNLVAEGDAVGVAAVLATNADLQVRVRRAPFLDSDPHQAPYTVAVQRL